MTKEITGWEKRQSVDSFMEEYWKQEEKLIGVFDKSQGVALNRIALEKTIMEKVVMRVETKEDGRKQYFAHLPELRVVDEIWVNGDKMATPQAIASAVEAREREISEAVDNIIGNKSFYDITKVDLQDIISIINPSKE